MVDKVVGHVCLSLSIRGVERWCVTPQEADLGPSEEEAASPSIAYSAFPLSCLVLS